MTLLRVIERTDLYWLFEIPPDVLAQESIELATKRFTWQHPDMIPHLLVSPSLHEELNNGAQVARGLKGRQFAFILGIRK